MTAIRKTATPNKMRLRRRRPDEVAAPRPCVGDHGQLVRRALADTAVKYDVTLRELAKV